MNGVIPLNNPYGNNILTLMDENGVEYTFEVLDEYDDGEKRYLALSPVFDNAEDIELPDRVQIIVDGMCGHYARLIYVDKILDCWCDDAEYFALKCSEEIPDKIFRDLNKAYCALYRKLLNKSQVEYALSFHYY